MAGADNYICLVISGDRSKYGIAGESGLAEVSVETFKTVAQISYLQRAVKYNPNFSTNAWFTEPETYSGESVTVPVRNWFIKDDM